MPIAWLQWAEAPAVTKCLHNISPRRVSPAKTEDASHSRWQRMTTFVSAFPRHGRHPMQTDTLVVTVVGERGRCHGMSDPLVTGTILTSVAAVPMQTRRPRLTTPVARIRTEDFAKEQGYKGPQSIFVVQLMRIEWTLVLSKQPPQ